MIEQQDAAGKWQQVDPPAAAAVVATASGWPGSTRCYLKALHKAELDIVFKLKELVQRVAEVAAQKEAGAGGQAGEGWARAAQGERMVWWGQASVG